MNLNPVEIIKKNIITGISIIDQKDSECQLQQCGIDLRLKEAVKISKNSFANVELIEKFDMQEYFGMLIIRSSFSRLGIFLSAGLFDPGFKGIGGISLYNLGEDAIFIVEKTRICQMIVFKANYYRMYEGHYNKNDTIESRYKEGKK